MTLPFPVRVEDFSFTWPGAGQRALSQLNLQLRPGEIILCSGAAGSGKSSLLLALTGLIPHKTGGKIAGSIKIDGQDTRDLSPLIISKTVAMSFQQPQDQFFTLTLREELAFSLEQQALDPSEIKKRVVEALEFTGLGGMEERSPQELSGGEMQRASLAILLARRPRVYLLDEPLAALDPQGRKEMIHLLGQVCHRDNAAMVICSKSPFPLLPLANSCLLLNQGESSGLIPKEDIQSILDNFKSSGVNLSQIYRLGEELKVDKHITEDLWKLSQAQKILRAM
ncbi:MAG: ABC transporter ATP-binding protein [Spirochaetaceae bacterium]|jgi:energy-coupling factor transporter ATP-binding protein EcfA2|nr:ABC transporter ATP-binding protein [Spirochaetaceae bacterium]